VVEPIGEYELIRTRSSHSSYGWLRYGDSSLPPAITYTGSALGFDLSLTYQTTHGINNEIQTENHWFFGSSTSFDSSVKPHAEFDFAYEGDEFRGVFTGTEEEKQAIKSVRWIAAPVDEKGNHPELDAKPGRGNFSSSDGTFGGSLGDLELRERDFVLTSGGGGGYAGGLDGTAITYPDHYLLELTVSTLPSGEVTARSQTVTVILSPTEGG